MLTHLTIKRFYTREEQLEMYNDPDKTKVYNLWLMSVLPIIKKIANNGKGIDDEVFADLYFWFLSNIKYFNPNIISLVPFTSMICKQRIRQNRIKHKSAKLPTEAMGNRDFGFQKEHIDTLDLTYYLNKVKKILSEEEFDIWYQRAMGAKPRDMTPDKEKAKQLSGIFSRAKNKIKNELYV